MLINGNLLGANRGDGGGVSTPSGFVFVLDEFTDTNGTNLSAHTVAPTNTPGNSWVADGGPVTIQSNEASVNGIDCHYNLEIGENKLTLQALSRNTDNVTVLSGCSISFRFVDSLNYWRLLRQKTTDTLSVTEITGGSTQGRGAVALTQTDISVARTMKVVDDGSVMTCSIVEDAADTFTTAAFSTHASATKIGINDPLAADTTAFYDDFKVTKT